VPKQHERSGLIIDEQLVALYGSNKGGNLLAVKLFGRQLTALVKG